MKRLISNGLGCLLALTIGSGLTPRGSSAQVDANPIHPSFPVLDKEGKLVFETKRDFSSRRTCGACHDADYIEQHTSHPRPPDAIDCIDCHLGRADSKNVTDHNGSDQPARSASPGEALTKDNRWALDEKGWAKRESLRIRAPESNQCGTCHGMVDTGQKPLAISPEIDHSVWRKDNYTPYSLTLGTGAIVSGQKISDSLLNLENKEELIFPWDVHAARLVQCRECHASINNPQHIATKRKSLSYLRVDPRNPSLAQYLKRPDHQLTQSDCRTCHDPSAVHDFLPYKTRHFRALSCQACHIAVLRGPAYQTVDETVVLRSGQRPISYRNMSRAPGQPINAAYLGGYQPLLVPVRSADGFTRFTPYNLITRWNWVDGARRRVPPEVVSKAYLEGDHYAKSVLELLDTDGNGTLDTGEQRLDTDRKVKTIAGRLAALGVGSPVIVGTVESTAIAHGVTDISQTERDCAACHRGKSRLSSPFAVSPYVPDRASVVWKQHDGLAVAGTFFRDASGKLQFLPGTGRFDFHVFGLSRQQASDRLGMILFTLVVLGCLAHGLGRVITRARRKKTDHGGEPVYVYSIYDRIWHWTMALSVAVLLVTGFRIHLGGSWAMLNMASAVTIHNVAAAILAINAFLTLFYHLTNNAIQKYIPSTGKLIGRLTAQVDYYLRGIFTGAVNPAEKTPKRRLNPLQQLTYLALFNILLPWQIVTGIAISAIAYWPSLDAFVGGLTVVAPLHNLGSWFFLCFFVLHHYLITTGASIGAELKAMVTGYEDSEHQPPMGKELPNAN
jgi:thiosulfate reductase cytochrome b subunit